MQKQMELFSSAIENFASEMKQVFLEAQKNELPKKEDKTVQEIEEMQPYYFNPNYKFNLPLVYRFHQHNMRYYFTVSDKDTNPQVKFYPSVTTILDKTMPFSDGLKIILGDKGYDGYKQFMNERANYGTFLHIQIADYLRSGDSPETRYYSLDDIPLKIEEFVKTNNVKSDTSYWAWDTKQDILSFRQFIEDYQVEPIAIEIVGVYDNGIHCYAGAIDMICDMTIEEKGYFGEVYKTGDRKGEPKESKNERRVRAIVDFKSGKSGFFENYEIQLHMYKRMAAAMGFEIEKCFNVSPKRWEGEIPTYNLKDQTDSTAVHKIPNLLAIFNADWSEPKNIRIISGTLNGSGIKEVCKIIPAKDFVLEKLGIKNENLSTN